MFFYSFRIQALSFFVCLFVQTFCFGQGSGVDGALNVTTGTTTINATATAVSGSNAIGNTINVASSAGFAVGNMVLVMQMFGTNAGRYDTLKIASLTGTSLTFTTSTNVAYSSVSADRAQVIKIPQYTSVSVSVGATLTAPAWNGTTGGVLIYYSNTTVTINGTINMTGKGFTGGTGGAASTATTAMPMTHVGNGGTMSGMAGSAPSFGGAAFDNGGMGGGMTAGRGGRGGSTVTPTGFNGQPGTGVVIGGNPSSGPTSLIMGGGGAGGRGGAAGAMGGGGGGGGAASSVVGITGQGSFGGFPTAGTNATGVGGTGGAGGGIILLYTNNFNGTGAFTANGNNGTNSTGVGGNGGNGGQGGNGGSNSMTAGTHGGGGGGGGNAGNGGYGPDGGSGGGAGVIVVYENAASWTGTMTSNPGGGGTGGAGGVAGVRGNPGNGGMPGTGGMFGMGGLTGHVGANGAAGNAGAAGTASQGPLIIGPLPVDLISFEGNDLGNKIVLRWTTSWEVNSKEFIVEKSLDGQNFFAVATIPAAGNTSLLTFYEAEDLSPNSGNNYYRLVQVDLDLQKDISTTILVKRTGSTAGLCYPNPVVRQSNLTILSEIKEEEISVSFYNSLFTKVTEVAIQSDADGKLMVQIPDSFAPGVYYFVAGKNAQEIRGKLQVQ